VLGLPHADHYEMFRFAGPTDDDHEERGEERGDERGAGLVEYALLISLIVLVCFAAVQLLGGSTSSIYSSAVTGLQ
jgi:Flp pilus assembly pilin Flp